MEMTINYLHVHVLIHIKLYYLPGRKSVREKTVPEVLSTAQGQRPRAVLKGTAFSYTDQPSPVSNCTISTD